MASTAGSLAARADELASRREPFVHATVVRAQHPTSAHAGDTALVLPSGEIHGFVGGNCVEESVREYSRQVLATQEPLLLRVLPGEPSRTAEEGAVEVTNPCLSGGAIEIFLQPRIPAPRVVVVGTTPVAQALETLGSGVGLEVELTDGESADPRGDDAALIVASHGKAEERALEAALRAGVPYVALVASRTRGAAVLESLDVDDALRRRVFTPAGLQLGGVVAYLGGRVLGQYDPFGGPEGDGRLLLQGPELRLPPKMAIAVALAFHELATNAVKYGALSVPEGRVDPEGHPLVQPVVDDARDELPLRGDGGSHCRPSML